MEVWSRCLEARRTGDFSAVVAAIPYTRFLGIEAADEHGAIRARLRYADMLIGYPRPATLHGGPVGALMETTAIFQLIRDSECGRMPETVDFAIDYLRPGRPREVFAKAVITRHGRRVANVQTLAWQDDPHKTIATGHGHFLLA